uniref:Reverse transcriptase domain-containing protein n=1 Tax=Oryzias latipes TaxID=8090 RepID=A0A3B3I4T3_ORYLA
MSSLNIVSWNVRGLGSGPKRLKVLNHLNDLKADIALLQETHLSLSAGHLLCCSQYPAMYSASFNSKQRGVAVLINKNVTFTHKDTVTDPEGRFVIINISIQNKDFCIASIYGPNFDDSSFFHRFFTSLSVHSDSTIIIGGDVNLVLDPELDRLSTAANQRTWQSASILKQYMNDLGLCDAWRSCHPSTKGFTFFSPVHHSQSRLDYLLVSNSLLKEIKSSNIHPIIISDHAPVSVTISREVPRPSGSTWRFNTSLLKDQEFIEFFKKEWATFLEFNDTSEISPSILWEAAKAVMRGKIISYSTHKKRKEKADLLELGNKIKTLETAYAASAQEHILGDLKNLKLQLNDIINKQTQFQIQRLRLERYENSNKSGKFLANQLKINKEKSTITSIMDQTGNVTHDPVKINNAFKDFYQNLYTPQINPSEQSINSFLNNINLPKLNEDQITNLDSPLSLSELHEALLLMPNGKAPGPDGFPAEFYKEFWEQLAPTFYKTVKFINESQSLPPNMNSANIILLLKPDKDPTSPSSYRPISLINADVKIICKALAQRIEKVTPHIIDFDQTGFIKGRHSDDNVRRLVNIIDFATIKNQEMTILSLDAEKAFDRVNWKFLIAALHKFGFGESFINWIKILYHNPNASVRTNKQTSNRFFLGRGTRQGCPLSPSLFAIFIEPLAAAIRQNESIKGIKTKHSHHKISLYADDILLFLSNIHSVNETATIINEFSSISDYSINWNKSVLLPLNSNAEQGLTIPVKSGNIKYLGIYFSPKISELVLLNYTPLLKNIQDDLTRWTNLPLSLMGKVATVKMKILPKVNYLFSMIPTQPPLKWFKTLDSSISSFLWNNKPARISLKTLKSAKSCGGLELPNFHNYFLANRLQYILKWLKNNPETNSWLDLEQALCGKINLSDLPFISQIVKKQDCFKSININATLTAWWEFLKISKSSIQPCKMTPIWNNPDILINKKIIHFPAWQAGGIKQLEHIIIDRRFITPQELQDKHGIYNFLEYQQLKSIITKKFKYRDNDLKLPDVVTTLINFSMNKTLSKIYKLLCNLDNNISLPTTKWDADLSISTDESFWSELCLNTFKMTKNPNLQLIHFKTLHRIYYTGQRMFKMGLSNSDICQHCDSNLPDNYMHALWFCTPVQALWQQVCADLSVWLKVSITASPSLCVLGDMSAIDVEGGLGSIIFITLCIAKKTILINWKSKKNINISQHRNLLLDHISLEKMSAQSSSNFERIRSLWSPIANSVT